MLLYGFDKIHKIVTLAKSEFLTQPVPADLHAFRGDVHKGSYVF